MDGNEIGLIAARELIAVLACHVITHAAVTSQFEELKLPKDQGYFLSLYAYSLEELAETLPIPKAQQVLMKLIEIIKEAEVVQTLHVPAPKSAD